MGKERTFEIIGLDELREKKLPVYHRYPGQAHPQPAHIYIDIMKRRVWVDWAAEANATPIEEWRGYVKSIPICEYITGEDLADYLEKNEELHALIERVLTGWEEEWDGNNYVLTLSDDGYAALEDLYVMAERDTRELADCSPVQAYEADDVIWTEGRKNSDDTEFSVTLGTGPVTITARTTDEELEELAEKLVEECEHNDVVILGGESAVEEELRSIRDNLDVPEAC